MEMHVQVAPDGSLRFLTASQEHVATLSASAVTALTGLVQVPAALNPVVHQHVQAIVQQQPAVLEELARLELTVQASDRTVHVTDAGHRLATWLIREWKPWARYIRRVPPAAVAWWAWNVEYRAGQVDRL